ncbi:hypothetical protein ABZ958_12650 [Streptomyces sp. NPDC046237]|uniref:hypothetical protein n=1 Tax=Streptomyces sp. NPDC046237 TaxID=3154914 RepID=UPI0033E5863B
MTQHHSESEDREWEDLIAELSEVRRTYRPVDDMAEPDEVPQAPSGTAMDTTMGDGATAQD